MEQELEGRLSEGNTLERRYRNHLRDVGLYDGIVDLSTIDREELLGRIERVEERAHAAYLLEEAVRIIRSSGYDISSVPALQRIGENTGHGVAAIALRDAERLIGYGGAGKRRVLSAVIDYAIELVENAGLSRQIGSRQGYREIIKGIEPDLAPLLVSAGVPGEAAAVITHHPTPSIARRVVRAGRYLLRTMRRMEMQSQRVRTPNDQQGVSEGDL